MIIKKPYGFLIKHFKLIHMLLLVPTLYLLLNLYCKYKKKEM